MTSAATAVRRTDRVRPPILEALTIAGVLGIAWVHILDLAGKMEETPYLGFAYIGLIAGCAAAAVLLTRRDHRGFLLAGGLAAATFLAYCLSRTTGLPAATDDIGNWTEALGVWSLVFEGAVVALSATALTRRLPGRSTHRLE